MIIMKTMEEIEKMRAAGKILAECHRQIAQMLKPGITTWEIDQFAEKFILSQGLPLNKKAIMAIHMRPAHL